MKVDHLHLKKEICTTCDERITDNYYYGECGIHHAYCCSEKCLKQWYRTKLQENMHHLIVEDEMCFYCGKNIKGEPALYYIEGWLSTGHFCSKECVEEWIED